MELKGRKVDIKMTTLMVNCMFLKFSSFQLFKLYGTDKLAEIFYDLQNTVGVSICQKDRREI